MPQHEGTLPVCPCAQCPLQQSSSESQSTLLPPVLGAQHMPIRRHTSPLSAQQSAFASQEEPVAPHVGAAPLPELPPVPAPLPAVPPEPPVVPPPPPAPPAAPPVPPCAEEPPLLGEPDSPLSPPLSSSPSSFTTHAPIVSAPTAATISAELRSLKGFFE